MSSDDQTNVINWQFAGIVVMSLGLENIRSYLERSQLGEVQEEEEAGDHG